MSLRAYCSHCGQEMIATTGGYLCRCGLIPTSAALRERWAKIANETLKRTGDEGRAIRTANAVIKRTRPYPKLRV